MNRLAVDQGDLGPRLSPPRRGLARRPRPARPAASWSASTAATRAGRFAEDAAAVLAGLGIPVRLFPDPVPTPLLSFSVPHLGAAGRRRGHGQPQPAARQRLQGLPRDAGPRSSPPSTPRSPRRIAAAPRLRRDRPPGAGRRGRARPAHPRRRRGRGGRGGLSRRASRRATLHGESAVPLRIAYTADARRRPPARDPRPHPGRLRGRRGRAVAGRSRRRLPHRLLPQPRGAGGDGPRARAGRGGAAPSSCSPTTPTPTASPPPCPTRRAAATGCSPATRSACCSRTTRSSTPTTGGRPKLVVTTVVSSSLLSRMARDRGVAYRETLTGFKWIADAAMRAEGEGLAFVLRLRGGARLSRSARWCGTRTASAPRCGSRRWPAT